MASTSNAKVVPGRSGLAKISEVGPDAAATPLHLQFRVLEDQS